MVLLGAAPPLAAGAGKLGEVLLEGELGRARASVDGSRLAILMRAGASRLWGLLVVDAADASRPAAAGFLAVDPGAQLALSDDGLRALLLVAPQRIPYNTAQPHKLIAVDLSDPRAPRELFVRSITARSVTLAPDASAYAASVPVDPQKNRWQTEVQWLDGKRSAARVEDEPYGPPAWRLARRGAFLVSVSGPRLVLFDLRPPEPARLEQEFGWIHRHQCAAAILESGHVVVEDARAPRLGVYAPSGHLPRIATLARGPGAYCDEANLAPGGELVFDVGGQALQWVDMRRPDKPALGRSMRVPPKARTLAVTRDRLYLAQAVAHGTLLHVYSSNAAFTAAVDWSRLAEAHRAAIETYRAEVSARKPAPYFEALRRLEDAGVTDALEAPPRGFNPARAAEILNDYGFLLGKHYGAAERAERALRRALELDSKRALAHLNLAQHLRAHLHSESDWERKAARAAEAAKHYRAYLALGGKRSSEISEYLAARALGSEKDICSAAASFANAGRLGELVSGTGIGVQTSVGRVDIVFTTQGTAHVPAFYAFNAETDVPVEIPFGSRQLDDLWGGDHLGLLVYGRDAHVLHFRDDRHPVRSFSLRDSGGCSFSVSTEEKIGPEAADPAVCKELARGEGQATVTFDGTAWMTREDVARRYSETGIGGTALIDIANDGDPVNVGIFGMASGAGAGCDATFFDLVDRNGAHFVSGPKRELLMQLQDASPSNRYPVLPCGNQPGFFKYKGKVYFETQPKHWPPVDRWHQYHRVRRVEQGRIIDVCDYRFETRVSAD